MCAREELCSAEVILLYSPGGSQAGSNATAAEACTNAAVAKCLNLLETCSRSMDALEAIERAVTDKLSGAQGGEAEEAGLQVAIWILGMHEQP